jgi:ABC-type spermidine/putrescine transport system permease subunit I
MYGRAQIFALLLPISLLLVAGLFIPMFQAITGSLFGRPVFAQSYVALARDPTFWLVLVRTLQTAGVVALLCLLIAYPAAEFLFRVPTGARPLAFALVIVPLWSSVIARTYSWVGVFQNDGLVDRIAEAFGSGPLRILYTQPAVIIGMVHVLLPLVLVPAYAAVSRYDARYSHASRSLGAGSLRTLLAIKLPLIAPQLLAATVAVFVLALGFFVTPAILGGPRSQLISNFISQQIYDRYDLPRAQAMSLALLIAALGALALFGIGAMLMRRRRR